MNGLDLLEPDALRSFAVFAEHRNFTTAAAALCISQPSLHVKVRKLATALGAELYERDGRSLVLTPAGEKLAAFALDTRARAEEFLGTLGGEPPELVIAAGRGAIRWVIPGAIRAASGKGRSACGWTTVAGPTSAPCWPRRRGTAGRCRRRCSGTSSTHPARSALRSAAG
jgi:hypothetical protein